MKLSALERCPSFALFGPGFTGGPWAAVTALRELPREGAPLPFPALRVAFAAYETPGREARLFSGELERFDALELDVAPLDAAPELDERGFLDGVGEIREAIAAGDVYQVNLTLRARLGAGSSAALFSTLCGRALPRFAAWVRLPGGPELVSASPELFFAVDGDRIRVEPMKGTAPAGERDRLQASAKDDAELAMITDLLRNDLSRLCVPRTVRVACERRLLELPYAVQAVSDVEGRLPAGATVRDVLAALHPGGSITGAPKENACAMIGRLEATPRGPYCGALAYLDGPRATASLLIRTATRTPDGFVYGAGAGITWLSDAETELAEVRTKLGALR